nr:uncharacterized protein LOC111422156 [Onthophagus taurus]
MQVALKLIETWCDEQRLSVNPKKTELILFTRMRKVGNPRMPSLADTPLVLSKEVKYLGITLDNKMTWRAHLDNRVKKAYVAFGQCRRAIGKTWGLSPRNALWIYTAVIRPMLTYGAVVWWSKTLQSTSTTALNKVQRLACLYVTGALRTTPTAAMENMLNLTPLHLFIQEVALVTMTRLRAAGILMGERNSKNANLWNEMVDYSPILECVTDFTPLQHIFTKKYLTHPSSTEVEVKNSLKIYTDGSKRREGAGAGVFSYDLRLHVSEPLGISTTVIQAELIAIQLAADVIVRSNLVGKTFTIYTDSRQAILALSRITITSGLVMGCHLTLEKAAVHNCVILQWIKGHSTCSGNKHADRLAKRAAKRAPCSPEPIIAPSLSTQIEIIKDFTHKKFMNWWDRVKGCHLSKEVLHYPSAEAALSFVRLYEL